MSEQLTITAHTPEPGAAAMQTLSALRMAQSALDMAAFGRLEGAVVMRNDALLAARKAGVPLRDLEDATHLTPAEIELAVARAELARAAGVAL